MTTTSPGESIGFIGVEINKAIERIQETLREKDEVLTPFAKDNVNKAIKKLGETLTAMQKEYCPFSEARPWYSERHEP